MEPLEFMERLAALVPRPRLHLIPSVDSGQAVSTVCWRPTRSCAVKSFPPRQSALPRPQARALTHRAHRRAHELGPAAQTGLRYRCGTLPKLRRRLEDHRRDRRSAGDRQDPQPSGPAKPAPHSAPQLVESIYSKRSEQSKTACQRKPTARLALTSTERRDKELSRPLSDRSARYNRGFFIKHKHKRKLTTLPILRYSSGHKKGRLKILSIRSDRAIASRN